MADLLLKRATASPGEVYDVMCEERIVGRIMLSADAQFPWVWALTYGYHKDRTPTHGYEAPREAAMQAVARSWHRECWTGMAGSASSTSVTGRSSSSLPTPSR